MLLHGLSILLLASGLLVFMVGGLKFLLAGFTPDGRWGTGWIMALPHLVYYLLVHRREAEGLLLIQVVGFLSLAIGALLHWKAAKWPVVQDGTDSPGIPGNG